MYDAMSQRLRAVYALAPARVYLVGEERATSRVAISTKSLSDLETYRQMREVGRKLASSIGHRVRESGFPEHWRIFVLLVVLSFFGAAVAARALIAGVNDTWIEIALVSVRHENQQLRLRQEVLREQTEAALAQIEAIEASQVSQASYAQNP